MKSSRKYMLKVLATGIFTFLIVSIVLFWVRWIPQAIFQRDIEKNLSIELSPSGLVPGELENDPNVVQKSRIHAKAYDLISSTCGMLADFADSTSISNEFRMRGRIGISNIYGLNEINNPQYLGAWELVYFDKKLGLFVSCELFKNRLGGKIVWNKKILLYAGPDGISEKPGKAIGKFIKPLNNKKWVYVNYMVLYDRVLRRFFIIDFGQENVKKGPEIKGDFLQPITTGQLKKNEYVLKLKWVAPQVLKEKHTRPATGKRRMSPKSATLKSINYDMTAEDNYGYLVIDKSGTIYQLDFKTLQLKRVGHLPEAGPLFTNAVGRPNTDGLLAYKVLPFFDSENHKPVYKGVIAASLSREGLGVALAVFDENGKLLKEEKKSITDKTRGCIAWMISKYIFENLQAPILSMASYSTANVFEAASGHKALFILPNSVVSMLRRDKGDSVIARFFFALVIISPSLLLSIWLAYLIRKDITAVGLSGRAKLYWTIATILFGISTYVTYRLTRPKDTLVTCKNCGKLRRPDMDNCHRCGSKWFVPELTPPTWRVISTG